MSEESLVLREEFRRPFSADDVEYKIQTVGKKAALCVAYVDARHVQERLNKVCAEHDYYWENRFKDPLVIADEVKAVTCEIAITHTQGYEVIHEDVGSLDNVNEEHHGLKALYSDAFKRAAVHFGIAVSLYSLPTMFLPIGKDKGMLRYGPQDKPVGITDKGKAILKAQYEQFLAKEGRRFGEVFVI